MDSSSITSLLYRSESDTLDFKRDQYAFIGASDEQKVELLKDLLAFANAWRADEAYIVVGADHSAGPPATVVGTADHPDDASFQQLINSKTNTPIRFNYLVADYNGTKVGIFRFHADQKRPVFLRNDFGRLKRNVVYVRRGSATEEATPDEVSEMVRADALRVPSTPVVCVEFADPISKTSFGDAVRTKRIKYIDPPPPPLRDGSLQLPPELLAELKAQMAIERVPIAALYAGSLLRPQPTPAQLRKSRQRRAALGSVGFRIRNMSGVLATHLQITLSGSIDGDLQVFDATSDPRNPRGDFLRPVMPVIHSDIYVKTYGDRWEGSISIERLQPQADHWTSADLVFGTLTPQSRKVDVRIFADNIPVPIEQALTLDFDVEEVVYREADFKKPARADDSED